MDTDRAIFLPPMASLTELRRATSRALLDGQKCLPFSIALEEHIYPGHFQQVLLDPSCFSVPEGEAPDGRILCCALWDDETGCGLLLHRQDGNVICAYLPIVTLDAAQTEADLSQRLLSIAHSSGDIPIHLGDPISAGSHALGDILRVFGCFPAIKQPRRSFGQAGFLLF